MLPSAPSVIVGVSALGSALPKSGPKRYPWDAPSPTGAIRQGGTSVDPGPLCSPQPFDEGACDNKQGIGRIV